MRKQEKRAAIYCRISNDREGRELGVERQQQDGRELAGRAGAVVVAVYIDNDISASTRSKKPRPRYKQMLADAASGHFEIIIAYTSSRLTRRPREHEDLIELAETRGIEFLYVRSPSFDLNTSAGRRVARILAANDAGEAEDAQERIQRQKRQAAELGEWKGGRRPFGYEADGQTVRASEAKLVLDASHTILAGGSINGLVKSFNAQGIKTSAGGRWDGQGVRRTLMRPRNAGLMEHQGEVIGKASWPAIVPEPVWRGVCAVLDDPSRRTTPGPARAWTGSGLYRCCCGAGVYVHSAGSSRKGSHPSYTCTVSKHMTRKAEEVDLFVAEAMIERLSRADARDLLVEDSGDDLADAVAGEKDLRAQLNDLAALFARREIDAEQLATASRPLRQELEEAKSRVAAASRTSVLVDVVEADDVGRFWREVMDLDWRRAVIDRLCVVELWQASKGRPKGWRPGESYFDPSSVKIYWKGPQAAPR